MKKESGNVYFLKVYEYNYARNAKVPELLSFNPTYGSTSLYETDTMIGFNFLSQAVYPSRKSDTPLVYGQIAIFRGAIQLDGTIIRTSQVLWQQQNLNDFATPNPFQQGDLMCTQDGQCNIILSASSNRLKAGEIYYLSFYLNSFSTKPSPGSSTRYYLFDDKVLPIGQVTAYDHLFFCRSFTIYSSNSLINGNYLQVNGVDLLQKSIFSKESQGGIATATFNTKSINLVFTIFNTDNPACTTVPPTGTVKIQDIYDSYFLIQNLNLRDCNEGELFADIYLTRGIRNQYGEFTHLREEQMKNVKLGSIGCDSSCLACNGTTDTNCVICADQSMFNYQGKCYSQCPAYAQYYLATTKIFQSALFDVLQCMQQCPFGMYPDQNTNECLNCNPDCQSCDSNLIASCLSCNPVKFLYHGKCLFQCPYPHHQNNLTDYSCSQISTSPTLSVKIQPLGYKSRIPKTQQFYLKAFIDNEGGSIVSIQWEQLEPKPTSPQIIIFNQDSFGVYITNTAVIQLKMTSFNYMANSQSVKVQCTVMNSVGDVAYDIQEFYINSPPNSGAVTLYLKDSSTGVNKVINENTTDNGTAPSQQFYIQSSNWVFNGKGLLYKLYMKVDSVYYLISEFFTSGTQYFRFPSISIDSTIKNISLCLLAQDEYMGEGTSCMVLFNIQNDLSYITDINKMISFAQQLDLENSMTDVIVASQMLYFALSQPVRQPSDDQICTLDIHCTYQGSCSSILGINMCQCQPTFTGAFCQFTQKQLYDLQDITSIMIQTLLNTVNSEFEISANEIELIGTVLRGILKDPDIVRNEDFAPCIKLIEMVGNSTIYAHYAVSQDVREVFLEALSYSQLKSIHSYKVMRTLNKDLRRIGLRLDLNQSQLNITSSGGSTSQRRNLVQLQGDENMSKRKIILSSGIAQQQQLQGNWMNQRKRNLQTLDQVQIDPSLLYSSIEEQYQDWGRKLDKGMISFITMFVQKLNPQNPLFLFKTGAFQVYAQTDYASAFKNQQKFIYDKDVYWFIPQSIFDAVQGQASDVQEVRLVLMKYLYNPFIFEQNAGAYVESNITTASFYNTNNDKLSIELLDQNYIDIRQPWNKSQGYSKEFLKCMYWDDKLHSFANNDKCSFYYIFDNIPCLTCAENEFINTSIALCRCTHMSRYGLVYAQTAPNTGLGTPPGIYSDFFAMQYWSSSFGYYAVLACLTLFLFGHLIIFFVDMKLQPQVIKRLRQRAKIMEGKGFKQRMIDLEALDQQSQMTNKLYQMLGIKKTPKAAVVNKAENLNDSNISPVTNLKQDENQQLIDEDGPQSFQKVDMKKGKKKGGKKGVAQESDRSSLLPTKGGKKTLRKNKNQDENILAETGKNLLQQQNENLQMEQDQESNFNSSGKGQSIKDDEKKTNKKIDGAENLENEQNQIEEEAKQTDEGQEDEEEDEEKMRKRYEEEQKDQGKKKEEKKAEEDEDSDDMDNYTQEQKKFLRQEKKKIEQNTYKLKKLFIYGNYATSLLFVTSIISPRHVRWTLLVACICLNWFWCAVIYNNTKSPLVLPDFTKKSYNLDVSDLWVSFISPFGTMILMYIFAGLFKISDKRLKHSHTSIYLELMFIELQKEMKLRFAIAYLISISIFSAVFWYIIKFTANFGWKVSWTWWYSGIYAILIQFCFIDPIVAFFHWACYHCSRHLALFCMKLRIIKQARTEA